MIETYKQKLIDSEPDKSRKSIIRNINIIVICSSGSPFGFIYNIIKSEFIDNGISKINMFFIVGRDRADFLDTIVDNFKEKDYINSISGLILEREGMETLKTTGMAGRTISEINPSEYSASFVRNLVKNNQKEDFVEIYSQYITPEEVEKLYETIKLGINLKSPPSKNEVENPYSRYFDGKLLPIMGSDDNNELNSSIANSIIKGGRKTRYHNKKGKKSKKGKKTIRNKKRYTKRKK